MFEGLRVKSSRCRFLNLHLLLSTNLRRTSVISTMRGIQKSPDVLYVLIVDPINYNWAQRIEVFN
jgi:hypothetical protein